VTHIGDSGGRAQLVARVRGFITALRSDRLYRTSVLLIGDSFFLGALSGLFILIATHVWQPRAIGVVSAIIGATGLLETVALLGLPATIVAHLAGEPDQALMVRGALLISVPVGIVLLSALWIVPGHFGVPFSDLGVGTPTEVTLTMILVVGTLIGSLIDPAFLARQEVSWSVGKDVSAMAIRFIALGILIGTGTAGYFAVAVIYAGSSALIDIVLFRWRVRRIPGSNSKWGLGLVWSHASFAVGSQVAVLASILPTSLLPLIVLSRLGPTDAAYAAIPVIIIGILIVVPAMTAQSLFAELAGHPEEILVPVRKALRSAYIVTLPLAVVVIGVAPLLLQLFGHGYSVHGRDLLRWGAASSVFFCLNYISDIVLLARKLVTAYVIANVVGSVFVLVSLYLSVSYGLGGLGLGWFIGQACYCAVSCVVLTTYVGRQNLPMVIRQIWH